MSNPGKITSALFSPRKLGGTGHLPAAEKKRLREERAARREQAASLARAAGARPRKPLVDEHCDPVDPGFATPSNEPDINPPKPSRAKAAK